VGRQIGVLGFNYETFDRYTLSGHVPMLVKVNAASKDLSGNVVKDVIETVG
jgi:hypothetical protein